MSTISTSEAVFVESTAGIATAPVSKITGDTYQVTIREVTGTGSVALTVQSMVGDSYETLYQSDGTTPQTMTLGSEQTLIVEGTLKNIRATSTDSPLPAYTLAVAKL